MKRNVVFGHCLCLLLLLCTNLVQASINEELYAGPSTGGGGAHTEIEIDEIRNNILQWIEAGRATELKFPQGLNVQKYTALMTPMLAPKFVVVGFVTLKQEEEARKFGNDELQVVVNSQPKECRGFISKKDGLRHILCSTERFPKNKAAQYRLIHHEYAGLAGVELNSGAASDYILSEQLTDKLEPELVFRLPITPKAEATLNFHTIRSQRASETRFIKVIDNDHYVGYRLCDVYGCTTIGNKEFYLKTSLKRTRNLNYAKVGGSAILAASLVYASAATGGYLAAYFLAAKASLGSLGLYTVGGMATGGSVGVGLAAKVKKLNPMTYWNQAQLLKNSLDGAAHEVVDLIDFSDSLAEILNGADM